MVRMDELAVGDIVKVGPKLYSKIFMFTHKLKEVEDEFVEISTASGAALVLTGGHYIPVEGSLVPAGSVRVGSLVQLGDGQSDVVTLTRMVSGSGLYNPQTLQGDIVVNGIIASTYTTAIDPLYAHAVLAPFRSMFRALGLELTFLESGGGEMFNPVLAVSIVS
jgi:Hint module